MNDKITKKEIKETIQFFTALQNNAIKRKNFNDSVEYGQKRIKWENMLNK